MRHWTTLSLLLALSIGPSGAAHDDRSEAILGDLVSSTARLSSLAAGIARKGGYGPTRMAVAARRLASEAATLAGAVRTGSEPADQALGRLGRTLASVQRSLGPGGATQEMRDLVSQAERLSGELAHVLSRAAPERPRHEEPPAGPPEEVQPPPASVTRRPVAPPDSAGGEAPHRGGGTVAPVVDLSATREDLQAMVQDLVGAARRLGGGAQEVEVAARGVSAGLDAGDRGAFKDSLRQLAEALDRYESGVGSQSAEREDIVRIFELARGLARREHVVGP